MTSSSSEGATGRLSPALVVDADARDQASAMGGTPGAVRDAQIVRQWTDDLVYVNSTDRQS